MRPVDIVLIAVIAAVIAGAVVLAVDGKGRNVLHLGGKKGGKLYAYSQTEDIQ